MCEKYYVTAYGDVHEVQCVDGEFHCSDCGAEGLQDGYLCCQSGAQGWHDSL